MTNLLIVSDNHGSIKELEILKERYQNMLMLNAGDLELDDEEAKLFNMISVAGNSFFDQDLELDRSLFIEDVKIYLTHGHRYGVKYGKSELIYYAYKNKYNLAIHGHTHVPDLEYDGDVFLICPGSVLRGYGKYRKTYCLLTIDGKKIKAELKELETGETFECLTNY